VGTFNLEELQSWARALLREAPLGHLAFVDDRDRPRVLPVTFALVAGALYSAVDEKPKRVAGPELARVRYLRRRPAAALCVDRYDDDWSRLAWVQVLGRVEVLEAAGESAALEALAAKYSPYAERRPPGPLLRLVPERAICWRAS
jgi:PPOX class probable F420-dependent enzyme